MGFATRTLGDDYFSEPPPLVRENDYLEADAYLKQFGE